MNMLKPHRRNPTRRRAAPKRFEDEKFVSGAIDRYQHCYDANRDGKYDSINGHENYYTSKRGHKFTTIEWNNHNTKYRIHKRDFTESLLEFTSIWRDMGRILPGDIVSHIGGFLRISDVDKELLADDDEFIVGDLSTDESASESEQDEDEYESEDETSEEEWDSDYSSDED